MINKAIVDIRLRPRCAIHRLISPLNCIYFFSLSPINAKLTSLSFALVILPINDQISPFFFYLSLGVISK